MTNVIIWNENIHEVENEEVKKIYPKGIHGCIKDFLSTDSSLKIKTATLKEDQNGLSEELLKNCDVLVWWGHKAHDEVLDKTVDLVQRRVLEGMGLIVLHSGHHSKIFKKIIDGDDIFYEASYKNENQLINSYDNLVNEIFELSK